VSARADQLVLLRVIHQGSCVEQRQCDVEHLRHRPGG
jgi:hypothetical protein